jgi:hypothetical protein
MDEKELVRDKLFRTWQPEQQVYAQSKEFANPFIMAVSDSFQKWGSLSSKFRGSRPRTTGAYEAAEIENIVIDLESQIESLKSELVSCTKRIADLCANLEERPTVIEAELTDIGEDFETLRPIRIVIEELDDEVTASFPEVELFAVGGTRSEAILNLKAALIELYADLVETPNNKLGKLPLSWLRILKKVMKPIGKQ